MSFFQMSIDEFEKECVAYVSHHLKDFDNFYINTKEGVYP